LTTLLSVDRLPIYWIVLVRTEHFNHIEPKDLQTQDKKPPEDASPLIVAMQWSSRITTIALEMALPGLGGFWLDHKLGSRPIFTILGTIAGFSLGMFHLIQLAKHK
jgi:F0F1-type ATP synthase assembly protein I